MDSLDINDLESFLLKGLTIEKRNYQLAATLEIVKHIQNNPMGSNSVLLNYPYGTGKTIIAMLTFLALKKESPRAKFVFTSAREAASLRTRQALEMAKEFKFVEKLGYLFDPKSVKGLSLAQRLKMYKASSIIFSPIQTLMNDRFQIKSRLHVDILSETQLCVIDEATDLIARSMTGFRLSKYFEEIFLVRTKDVNFPILGMTGSRDHHRVKAILGFLDNNAHLMQRPELQPYETITQIKPIERRDYIKIDQVLSGLITKPIGTIQELLDPNLSRLEIIKLSYGGILERLQKDNVSYPIKIAKYQVYDDESRQKLINAFVLLFKLTHSRLLLLENTPGEFLRYIKAEENQEALHSLINISSEIISHRAEFPQFENPEEKTVRGLIHPKIELAIGIIHEHLVRGAKILLFTRFIALAEQMLMLLKTLKFPGVKFLSGKTPEDTRRIILEKFQKEDVDVLIFTPIGGRGLNLGEADIVIHLDITSNLDDMTQRRERARGCMEYVLVLSGTSEEEKVKGYTELTKAKTEK